MARVTHVKSARALYHTKPVLNEDGTEKRSPVTTKRYVDGEYVTVPKKDKRGKEITTAVTVRDLDRPKPNLRCDFANCDIDGGEIPPGTSYKFIALRHGQKNRHAAHPNWKVWEYSSSIAAQAAQLQAGMHNEVDAFDFSAEEDFDSLRDSLAEQVQGFIDERQESLDNMPEQLQDGSRAQEALEAAEEWLSEVENVSGPDEPFRASTWAVVDAGGTNVYGTETFGSEDEAADMLDTYLENNLGVEEGDLSVAEGDGEDGEVNEDWVEAARDALRETIDAAGF